MENNKYIRIYIIEKENLKKICISTINLDELLILKDSDIHIK